jgi:hypothetical protein
MMNHSDFTGKEVGRNDRFESWASSHALLFSRSLHSRFDQTSLEPVDRSTAEGMRRMTSFSAPSATKTPSLTSKAHSGLSGLIALFVDPFRQAQREWTSSLLPQADAAHPSSLRQQRLLRRRITRGARSDRLSSN